MTPEQRLQFLRDEYLLLQGHYEDFDRRTLTIKGWVSAGAFAAVALGLEKATAPGSALWIAIAVMAACFWFLEWRWKTFQVALDPRLLHIEALFRGDRAAAEARGEVPFQTFDWFVRAFKAQRLSSLRLAVYGSVMLPYVPIIAFSVWAWLYGVPR